MSRKGWVILLVVGIALWVILVKFRNQRRLDITLAQLVDKGATSSKVTPLLKKGASPNARVQEEESNPPASLPVVLVAYEKGRMDVFKSLLDEGANPNAPARWGGTILGYVSHDISEPSQKAVRMLIDKGANVNAPDEYFGSALIAATLGASLPNVKVLLENGAKSTVNAQHPDTGATALMIAADRGNVNIVEVLLDAGADPSLKDRKGKTALDYAKQAAQYNAQGGLVSIDRQGRPIFGNIPDEQKKILARNFSKVIKMLETSLTKSKESHNEDSK